SASLLSRNDGSVITTGENRLVGMAQYAGFGRAYVFPAAVLRDKVAKRVLAKRGSVAAGGLGAMGESVAGLPEPELDAIGLPEKNGVLVREVSPQGPAALAGLLPNDVIVGLDTAEVTGVADLSAMLASEPAGESISLRAIRNRQPVEIKV